MIRKPPTISETPAKPSIAYFMKFRPLPMLLLFSSFCSAAVLTW